MVVIMPVTPFHFGPSGFTGLILRRWVDPVIFVLVNVVVDLEVFAVMFFRLGYPIHRHVHTMLIGGIVGAAFGIAVFLIKPARIAVEQLMKFLRIPYKPSLWKMAVGGFTGACLHSLIDSTYHYDVHPFWPYGRNPLWQKIFHGPFRSMRHDVETFCIIFAVLAVVVYILIVVSSAVKKKSRVKNQTG